MLLAYRGDDADRIREFAMRRGTLTNIPPKRNRSNTINRIERFFNKIKLCRRVATRHDKLAANYLALV